MLDWVKEKFGGGSSKSEYKPLENDVEMGNSASSAPMAATAAHTAAANDIDAEDDEFGGEEKSFFEVRLYLFPLVRAFAFFSAPLPSLTAPFLFTCGPSGNG